jgi:predicted RNA-binding Zn-ribbon protein involved in translation (DUF1610 family)
MKEKPAKGAWGLRTLIRLFTVILGVLIFWLLGFVVKDIKSVKGPEYAKIELKHLDQALLEKKKELNRQIGGLERDISHKNDQKRLIGDSSENLLRTINQLMELQKLSLQKGLSFSDAEKANLAASLSNFLENQKTYQGLNQGIADLTSKKLRMEEDRRQIDQEINKAKEPARKEFEKQYESHRLRLAFFQLLILVPLLLGAGILLLKLRASIYFPLFLAFGGATLVKAALVIHEYFPSRYFKYILLLALLGVVARLLIHFIRTVAYPRKDWLRRQYREAYESFMCPVCEYPIRTGPRRFLYWTRRTIHKVLPRGDAAEKPGPYSCPSCGAHLFEECPSCHQIRHALLDYCEHCGAEKEVAAGSGNLS